MFLSSHTVRFWLLSHTRLPPEWVVEMRCRDRGVCEKKLLECLFRQHLKRVYTVSNSDLSFIANV